MTVFLRALFGPFHRTAHRDHIDWHFFGVRDDNSMGRWTLRFETETRKYKLVTYPMDDKPALPEHRDMFVPNKPQVYGATYVDILKKRLTGDDIAFLTRTSLNRRK